MRITRVISGGRTGADQGGLLAASVVGVPTGGWAAKGWATENGRAAILRDYGLRECDQPGYPARTRRNVADADAVVWFGNPHSPGGRLTLSLCCELAKDHYVVMAASTPQDVIDWLRGGIAVEGDVALMVAGNRESSRPGIATTARVFMETVLRSLGPDEVCRTAEV